MNAELKAEDSLLLELKEAEKASQHNLLLR